MSDGECPMVKRSKLESNMSEETKLDHFDVIDEVQCDGSATEYGMRRIYQISSLNVRC